MSQSLDVESLSDAATAAEVALDGAGVAFGRGGAAFAGGEALVARNDAIDFGSDLGAAADFGADKAGAGTAAGLRSGAPRLKNDTTSDSDFAWSASAWVPALASSTSEAFWVVT